MLRQPLARRSAGGPFGPRRDIRRRQRHRALLEAGASDVHWVIATDNQVEQGISAALARVKSGRVLIEGTSLLKFIEADFVVMVARPDQVGRTKIKPSARRALAGGLVDAIYFSGEDEARRSKILCRRNWRARRRYTPARCGHS